jgi:hypothetical protein
MSARARLREILGRAIAIELSFPIVVNSQIWLSRYASVTRPYYTVLNVLCLIFDRYRQQIQLSGYVVMHNQSLRLSSPHPTVSYHETSLKMPTNYHLLLCHITCPMGIILSPFHRQARHACACVPGADLTTTAHGIDPALTFRNRTPDTFKGWHFYG